MNRDVPAIRFAGFSEPWEQRKFEETFTFLGNNTLSRAELSDTEGTCFDVHYGDVLIKYGEVLDAAADQIPHITDDGVAASLSCQPLQDGDVIIADTAEDEAVGKCSELRNVGDKTIYSGLHTMPCRPIDAFAPGYLGFYLNSDAYHSQLLPLMQGIKVISVSRSAIEGTYVLYPSQPEQRQIGTLFSRLDSLITLHQRKHEQLSTLKKSLLEKMFPKPSADVPELRFVGFTEPWEQRKLGSCLLVQRGGSPRPIDDYITEEPSGINWIKIGDVAPGSRYITKTAEKIRPEGEAKSRHVYVGDLILSNSMSFGRPYILQVEGCIHDGWLLIRDETKLFDIEFLQQLLSTPGMYSQYRALAAGGVVNNLNSELVQSATITFPSLPEQRQIGALFSRLDSLITLHQRKLDLLGNIKKSLLEKMFV